MPGKRRTSSSSERKTGGAGKLAARTRAAAQDFAGDARETGASVLESLGTLDSVLASLLSGTATALGEDRRVMSAAARNMRDSPAQSREQEDPAGTESAGDEAVATLDGDPRALERLLLQRFEAANDDERASMFRRVVQEFLALSQERAEAAGAKPRGRSQSSGKTGGTSQRDSKTGGRRSGSSTGGRGRKR